MIRRTHEDLCEAIQLVTDAASRYSGGRPFLREWRAWARIVAAGLYCAKTADRAARSALVEAHADARVSPLADVARAAALVAIAVFHLVQKNEDAARETAALAASVVENVDARERSGRRRRGRLAVIRGRAEPHDHEQAAAAPRCRSGSDRLEHVRLRA